MYNHKTAFAIAMGLAGMLSVASMASAQTQCRNTGSIFFQTIQCDAGLVRAVASGSSDIQQTGGGAPCQGVNGGTSKNCVLTVNMISNTANVGTLKDVANGAGRTPGNPTGPLIVCSASDADRGLNTVRTNNNCVGAGSIDINGTDNP